MLSIQTKEFSPLKLSMLVFSSWGGIHATVTGYGLFVVSECR
jgi:hypothetical protein